MRSQGSAEELERRRRLAVGRVKEGYAQQEVATFLGVHPRTVSRWVCAARVGGVEALKHLLRAADLLPQQIEFRLHGGEFALRGIGRGGGRGRFSAGDDIKCPADLLERY